MATTSAVAPASKRRYFSFAYIFTTFPFAVGSALALGIFASIRDLLPDPDIFWHLCNAQYFAQHLRVISTDIYSFTAQGLPSLDHEWLSELAYYGAYRGFGWQGVLALYSALMIAIVLMVYWLARREGADPLVAGLATALGSVLLLGVSPGPRTQHFGWLCFLAIYAILQKYRRDRVAPLWAVPILFCLWINVHAGWLGGAAVCVLLVLCGLPRRDIGNLEASPWTAAELKKLVIIGILSVAALFIHPAGYKAVLYPLGVMSHMPPESVVTEWASLPLANRLGSYAIVAMGAVFLAAVLSKKRWRIDEVLLTLFVFYFGLKHVRLLVLPGMLAPLILARHVRSVSSYRPTEEKRKLNFAVTCLAILGLVFLFPSQHKLQQQIDREFPAGALAYIRAHHISGRMFNDYNWGGYLEWSLPEIKTFVDGRGDVFNFGGVLTDYVQAIRVHQSREILDRYKIDFVLMNREWALTYLLNNTSGWQRTYQDEISVIFQRAP